MLIISNNWKYDLPEYTIGEAEELLLEILEIDRIYWIDLTGLISVVKETGNIHSLKEWIGQFKKIKELENEITTMKHHKEDLTESIFIKGSELKELDKEIRKMA